MCHFFKERSKFLQSIFLVPNQGKSLGKRIGDHETFPNRKMTPNESVFLPRENNFVIANLGSHNLMVEYFYLRFSKIITRNVKNNYVKKRSQILYSVSFENTETGPLFFAPVKFKDYYHYENNQQVPGLRPAIPLFGYRSHPPCRVFWGFEGRGDCRKSGSKRRLRRAFLFVFFYLYYVS